jgi:hypothetical protein
MSAAPKTIEGTWDEVVKHATELAGHRLRVTVIDEVPNPYDHPAFDTSPAAIDGWISRFREHLAKLPELGVLDDSRDAIYDEQLDHQL